MAKIDLLTRFEVKRDWPFWLLIIGLFAVGAYLYPQLPERVPSHWNIQGEIDRYSSRFFGAFGIPLMALAIYVLMLFVPYLDPRSENYTRMPGTYNLVRRALVGFLAVLQIVVLSSALGYPVAVGVITQVSVSILFILIGNSMGRIKHNYTFGIRTPWTLADEGVWRKTHRLGGRTFVMAGFIGLAGAWLPAPFNAWVFFVSIFGAVFIPSIYSYLLYRNG